VNCARLSMNWKKGRLSERDNVILAISQTASAWDGMHLKFPTDATRQSFSASTFVPPDRY
jgi:hypothetical protein